MTHAAFRAQTCMPTTHVLGLAGKTHQRKYIPEKYNYNVKKIVAAGADIPCNDLVN
jgi:hypothetical protein